MDLGDPLEVSRRALNLFSNRCFTILLSVSHAKSIPMQIVDNPSLMAYIRIVNL